MKQQGEVSGVTERRDAIDIVLKKAAQLESLLAVLAHTAGDYELRPEHREVVCWLGAEMASTISAAASAA